MIPQLIASHGAGTVTTIAAGTTFVTLPDIDCNEIVIFNESGARIDIQPTSSTDFVTIGGSAGVTLPTTANAKEWAIRRNDQGATLTTVRFLHRKFLRG